MKKIITFAIAVLFSTAANAQEINAVVTRNDNRQSCYQLSNNPNVTFGTGNSISVNEGETQKEQYTLSESNTLTVLFGSAINSEVNAEGLEIAHPIYILNNGKLTVSGTMANENAQNLVIEDGGQLRFDAGTPNAIVKKSITGYNDGEGNWYLVASPVAGTDAPAGMLDETADNYDLYIFNQSSEDGLEWNNYKVQSFEIGDQNGYLYAHKDGTTLYFNGQLNPTANAKNLEYDETAEFAGFNLIGNPFTCDAYIDRDFYRMNTEGNDLVPSTGAIHALEGVFVKAQASAENVTFSKTAPSTSNSICALTLNQGNGVIDRAIIHFGKGKDLDKFMLNDSNTKLFIPQSQKDLASISTEATIGEMPVNFKAAKDGSYTISVNVGDVGANYLHLVDNMTGMDVDLLATPSYSFEAKTNDYASRFKLVFGVKDDSENPKADFAFISNGNLVIDNIEGQKTLQIIDVNGHVISSEIVSGSYNKAIYITPGLYIISLDGMTQKIVVK